MCSVSLLLEAFYWNVISLLGNLPYLPKKFTAVSPRHYHVLTNYCTVINLQNEKN